MEIRNKMTAVRVLFVVLAMALLAGCGGSSGHSAPAPNPPALSAGNVNLIFVVSEDLAYQAPGDINPKHGEPYQSGFAAVAAHGHVPATAGARDQECHRHLRAGTDDPFANREAITPTWPRLRPFSSSPCSTRSRCPVTLRAGPSFRPQLPDQCILCGRVDTQRSCHAIAVLPELPGSRFQRPRRRQRNSGNPYAPGKLPGFYVFSAPWETISVLLANINKLEGYNLTLPASLCRPQLYLCDLDHAVGKRQPGYLQQQCEPAFHLPRAARAGAGQYSMQAADAFQHHRDRRQRWRRSSGGKPIPTRPSTSFGTQTHIRAATGTTTTMSVRGNGARWIFPTHCAAKSALTRFGRETSLNLPRAR